ncbi:MAG: c-type cytochrome [Planctomycetaceae bacterium]|nr:c-type cytochrome [Planctomycetaceae bacterium]
MVELSSGRGIRLVCGFRGSILFAILSALLLFASPFRLVADDAAPDVDSVVTLLDLVLDADENTARKCLNVLTTHVQNRSLPDERVQSLKKELGERLNEIVADDANSLRFDAALLTAAWGDANGLKVVRGEAMKATSQEQQLAAFQVLVAAKDKETIPIARRLLGQDKVEPEFQGNLIATLGRYVDPSVASLLLEQIPKLSPDVAPKAIEVLSQRPLWSGPLLKAIAAKRIPAESLNVNQLRRVASFQDEAIQKQFKEIYGTIREGRNPNREQVFYKMRDFLKGTPGDPVQGQAVFTKICAQCHKIYGEGADVGPDITRNGRNNWDQLLMNVFDPSAVIGPGYQARILAVDDGRVLTGLPVEESDTQVILKIQGGKREIIPRDQIEEYKTSEVSLMPDELEKQLTPQQLADLFAFLALDQPPGSPDAKLLNGAPEPQTR